MPVGWWFDTTMEECKNTEILGYRQKKAPVPPTTGTNRASRQVSLNSRVCEPLSLYAVGIHERACPGEVESCVASLVIVEK